MIPMRGSDHALYRYFRKNPWDLKSLVGFEIPDPCKKHIQTPRAPENFRVCFGWVMVRKMTSQ